MIRNTFWTALVCAGAVPASSQDLSLAFPVDCDLGETCFIQNYVDRDPSSGHRDFGCGHLSYDGHSGTDIALFTELEIDRNVAVRPVAPGTVRATRDGMPDINATHPDAPDLSGRACGNAVVVTHSDGWETRYCHLRRGSVAVQTGDPVTSDTVIGAVGLSGKTEFPHLHLTVVRGGQTVDPFQPDGAQSCGDTGNALWRDSINYVPAGLLSAGVSPDLPGYSAIKAGNAHSKELPASSKALVFWAHFFGPKVGDQIVFQIMGPNSVFLDQTVEIDRDQARAFRAVGRKLTADSWPKGDYSANIGLWRDGSLVDQITTTVLVN